MAQNYLHECLGQFPEVSEKRWDRGKPFDLEALERKVQDLRSRKVKIEDIQKRFEQHFKETSDWWFDKYWLIPPLSALSQKQEKKISFHQLNEGGSKEKRAIQDLLKAFRHIELVSIILRFIRPDSFGILSPPVEHILELRRGRNAVETYLNYLRNLRRIRNEDKYKLDTAAEADMALWVLEHKCHVEEMKDERIKKTFEEDEFMTRLRAENLATPLGDISLARRAIAFHTIDNDLAALIGCYALEKYVAKLAAVEKAEEEAKRLAKLAKKERPTLDHRIKALDNKGTFSFFDNNDRDYLRRIRNRVFHGEEISGIDNKEFSSLVEVVLKLEQRLEGLQDYSKELN